MRRRTLRRIRRPLRRARSGPRRLQPTRPGVLRGCVRAHDGQIAAHVRVLLDGSPLADEGGRFTAWIAATRTYTLTVVDRLSGRTLLVRRAVLEIGAQHDLELRLD